MAIKYSINRLKESLLFPSGANSLTSQHLQNMKKCEHYLSIKQTSDEASNLKSKIFELIQFLTFFYLSN